MYRLIRVAVPGAALLLLLGVGTMMADAQAAPANTVSNNTTNVNRPTPEPVVSPTNTTQIQGSNGQGTSSSGNKLSANALKICERRQATIDTLIARINARSRNQLALFATIAARVETFYTSKSRNVSDYDKLVADINNSETKAQSALGALSVGFDCSGNDPKAVAQAFVANVKQEVTDLQAFRSSVSNLIVAVANANGVKLGSLRSGSGGNQQ